MIHLFFATRYIFFDKIQKMYLNWGAFVMIFAPTNDKLIPSAMSLNTNYCLFTKYLYRWRGYNWVLYLFLLLFSNNLFSQGWERVYNQFPLEGEVARGIIPMADGGFILLGTRNTVAPDGGDTYLQKVDQEGNIQWSKDIFNGEGLKITQLLNGNLVTIARVPVDTIQFEYHFIITDPLANLVLADTIHAVGGVDFKFFDLIPVNYGANWVGGFLIGVRGTYPGQAGVFSYLLPYEADGSSASPILLYDFSGPSNSAMVLRDITQTPNGKFYGVGFFNYPADHDADPFWFKLENSGGQMLSFITDDPAGNTVLHDTYHEIAEASDGNFWVMGIDRLALGPDSAQLYIEKLTPTGQKLMHKVLASNLATQEFAGYDRSKIIAQPDGGAVILYESYFPATTGEDFSLMKINASGDLVWLRQYGREKRFIESPFDFCPTATGGWAIAGWFNDSDFGSNDAYLIRTDAAGLVNQNVIKGSVYADNNNNCQQEAAEKSLAGWTVSLEKAGQLQFYTITDSSGHFAFGAGAGNYTVKLLPPANFWQPCNGSQSVSLGASFDTATVNFGAKPTYTCQQLEVDIATPYLRRCFDSYYTITYANRGTVDVQNAKVKISLDPSLTFLSANIPWSWQGGNDFLCSVGNLPIGSVGHFRMNVKVNCNAHLGQTHCTKAEITPFEACNSSSWSGASIEADGQCDNPNVSLIIRNGGTSNITTPLEFIIIEDQIIFLQGHIHNLPPGADTTISVPANGKTWRIECQQEPGHPGNSQPSAAVEGCGSGSTSSGYITIFPQDDNDPYVCIDCMENIGSFDPNDKQGFPKGVADEHYIAPDVPIDYLIRFQNTGTDTAFTVQIRDTLTDLLDIHSVVPGASSHPYIMELVGLNTLKFTFKKINLPDSTTHVANSHGFVKFKVLPKQNIPLGSTIYNTAAIYFDYNEPIFTNETFHTVDTGFLAHAPVSVQNPEFELRTSTLQVHPNPTDEFAWIYAQNQLPHTIGVYTLEGILVGEISMIGGKGMAKRNGLSAGIYILKSLTEAESRAVGKLIFR